MPWEPTLGCHLDDSHMHEMAGNQNVDIIYLGTCISSTWVSGLRISPRGYGPSAAPSYPRANAAASTLLVSVQVSVRTTGQAFTAFRTEYRVFQAVFPGKSGQLKL